MAVKKVAGTKDEQVMAVFTKRCRQKIKKNATYVLTASTRQLVLLAAGIIRGSTIGSV